MDRNTTEVLIRKLQLFPCLYAWKSAEYKDKAKKTWALQTMCADMKKVDPSLTVDQIETKVKSLRSQYARELRYQKKQISKGHFNFIPKLWCFKQLSFLKEHIQTPKKVLAGYRNGGIKYYPSEDEETFFEVTDVKINADEQFCNDADDAAVGTDNYEMDLNDSVQNDYEDIIEEDNTWVENEVKVNTAYKDKEEELYNAQITYFQNQELRAKEKHEWEKNQAAEKHRWCVKINETKFKILQADLAIKLKEIKKNSSC